MSCLKAPQSKNSRFAVMKFDQEVRILQDLLNCVVQVHENIRKKALI